METKFRKKEFAVLATMFHVGLPLIGGYIGYTIFGGYLGPILCIAFMIFIAATGDFIFFTRWKYELTWKDIDLALYNYYKYGPNLGEFWFRAGKRKILIYRNEDGGKKNPVRMEVAVPEKEWSDLLSPEDCEKIESSIGCQILLYDYGKDKYLFFKKNTKEHSEFCKAILSILFTKSVGGLTPEIMAENRDDLYWLDNSNREEKLLSRKRFFDGKKVKNKAIGKTKKNK